MPALVESDFVALIEALADHALRTGWFDRVNKHEPKNAPGHGLTSAIWVDRIEPIRGGSGLNSTSARFVVNVRIYQNALSDPPDAIDPHLTAAVNELMLAYSGDFTLDGLVRDVDLLGAHGIPLSAVAGYLTQDKTIYRVMTITVPLIVNDVWEQNA
ncbi:hypothetical protein ABZ215_13535 [Amycolatopsis sp. NPDC006131]|uniref:hypothetical protein n=1 Tax=Amycolatopsis sp. NPDC006131 TaxID=3156731 RepID=UPI0033A36E4A